MQPSTPTPLISSKPLFTRPLRVDLRRDGRTAHRARMNTTLSFSPNRRHGSGDPNPGSDPDLVIEKSNLLSFSVSVFKFDLTDNISSNILPSNCCDKKAREGGYVLSYNRGSEEDVI
jgi:hypothetical protein